MDNATRPTRPTRAWPEARAHELLGMVTEAEDLVGRMKAIMLELARMDRRGRRREPEDAEPA